MKIYLYRLKNSYPSPFGYLLRLIVALVNLVIRNRIAKIIYSIALLLPIQAETLFNFGMRIYGANAKFSGLSESEAPLER